MIDITDLSMDGYQLERVLDIRSKCERIIDWMLNEKCSIRDCAKDVGMPKSTIHQYIHTYIRDGWDEEYQEIKVILRWNKRERFKPKKYWRGRPW